VSVAQRVKAARRIGVNGDVDVSGLDGFVSVVVEGAEAWRLGASGDAEDRVAAWCGLERGAASLDQAGGDEPLRGVGLVRWGEVFPGALVAAGGQDAVEHAGSRGVGRSGRLALAAALRAGCDEVGAGA